MAAASIGNSRKRIQGDLNRIYIGDGTGVPFDEQCTPFSHDNGSVRSFETKLLFSCQRQAMSKCQEQSRQMKFKRS